MQSRLEVRWVNYLYCHSRMILKTLPKNKNKTLWLCQPLILSDISFICNSERKEMITQKDWKCVICDQEESVSFVGKSKQMLTLQKWNVTISDKYKMKSEE